MVRALKRVKGPDTSVPLQEVSCFILGDNNALLKHYGSWKNQTIYIHVSVNVALEKGIISLIQTTQVMGSRDKHIFFSKAKQKREQNSKTSGQSLEWILKNREDVFFSTVQTIFNLTFFFFQ